MVLQLKYTVTLNISIFNLHASTYSKSISYDAMHAVMHVQRIHTSGQEVVTLRS